MFCEPGGAGVVGQQTGTGSTATIVLTADVTDAITLTVTATTSTSGAPNAGTQDPVTLSTSGTLPADRVDFGTLTSNCGITPNGACYLISGVSAAHFVATLHADVVYGTYGLGSTKPGLRICRSPAGGSEWPSGRLLAQTGTGNSWTVDRSGWALTDLGADCTGGLVLFSPVTDDSASGTLSADFQIAGRVEATDAGGASFSSTITFEAY